MGKKSKESAPAVESPVKTPSKKTDSDDKDDLYESRLKAVSLIAHPLANKKLNKKILKTVKKATKAKAVKRGVKEVVKGLRKGQKGFVIIAGDISPIDVITHIPVLCEDSSVPYVYVPSKEDLGTAGLTKRPTSCILITDKEDVEGYSELFTEVKKLNSTLSK